MSRISALLAAAFLMSASFGCSEKPSRAPAQDSAAEESATPAAAPAGEIEHYDIFADEAPASARETGDSIFGGAVGFEEPDAVIIPDSAPAPVPDRSAPAGDRIEM